MSEWTEQAEALVDELMEDHERAGRQRRAAAAAQRDAAAVAAEEEGRLGNNAKFVAMANRFTESGLSDADGDLLRGRMRATHRDLNPASKNQQKCGVIRRKKEVEVRKAEGRAYLGGLVSCASWHSCPVCSRRIARNRAEEIERALEAHHGNGGSTMLLTLTMAHTAGHALKRLYRGLADAWRKVTMERAWREAREDLRIVGTVRATDCTLGQNGWHPHLHVLVLTEDALDEKGMTALEDRLYEVFSRKVVEIVGEEHRPAHRDQVGSGVGVNIQAGTRAGSYVAKMGLAREITSIGTKEGAGGRRTPFEILRDVATRGTLEDRELWLEWSRAMKNQVQVQWSPGLREKLGIANREMTPEEIIEAAEADDTWESEHVTWIDAPSWRAVRSQSAGEARIQYVAAMAPDKETAARSVKALVEVAVRNAPQETDAMRELQSAENPISSKIEGSAALKVKRAKTKLARERRLAKTVTTGGDDVA